MAVDFSDVLNLNYFKFKVILDKYPTILDIISI